MNEMLRDTTAAVPEGIQKSPYHRKQFLEVELAGLRKDITMTSGLIIKFHKRLHFQTQIAEQSIWSPWHSERALSSKI